MTTQMRALLGMLVALPLASCTKDDAPSAPPAERAEAGALEKAKALLDSTLGPGRSAPILAFASDGSVVYGAERPAPPNSDAALALDAMWLSARPGARPVAIDVGPIQSAAVAPSGDRVAVVTSPAGALVLWSPSASEALDDDVMPGVSFAADGTRVTYAKGPAPELDIYAIDLKSKQKSRLTDDPAPDYLPALSPDGASLVFVSTRGGTPALWIAGARGESPRRLTAERFPAPDGPIAPLFGARVIAYEAGGGVVVIDASTGASLGERRGARQPHWLVPDSEVGFEVGGTLESLKLSPAGGAL